MAELRSDDHISSGVLSQVLIGWRSPRFRFYVLYPSHRSMTLKLRAFLDFFSEKLGHQQPPATHS